MLVTPERALRPSFALVGICLGAIGLCPRYADAQSIGQLGVPVISSPPIFDVNHGCAGGATQARPTATDDGYQRANVFSVAPNVTGYVVRTATDLYFCFAGIDLRGKNGAGGYNAPSGLVSVFFDVDHTRSAAVTSRDYVITSSALSSSSAVGISGSGDFFGGAGISPELWDVTGADAQVGAEAISWNAAFHLNVAALGDWHTIGFRAFMAGGGVQESWPNGSSDLAPDTWGELILGDGALLPPHVIGVTPLSGSTPMARQPGTTVTLYGVGFTNGTPDVYFGNTAAKATVQSRSDTKLVVEVPRLATSGPILLKQTTPSPGSASIGRDIFVGPFVVRSYRNTFGYRFVNFTAQDSDSSYDDFTQVFGADQTKWFWGAVDNPLAWVFWKGAKALLRDGVCFGMSYTGLRMYYHDQSLVDFPAITATPAQRTWDLSDPNNRAARATADPLLHAIATWHLTQFSAEAIHNYVGNRLRIYANHRYGHDLLMQNFKVGELSVLDIDKSAGDGHSLVAYDAEDTADGGYLVYVDDPNLPFDGDSENDESSVGLDGIPNAITHVNRENHSIVRVQPNGNWSFLGNFGGGWSNSAEHMVPLPYHSLPTHHPTLPDSLEGLFTIIFGSAGITQLADDAGHTLFTPDGEVNVDPATGLPQATRLTMDGTVDAVATLVPGRYRQTIHGTDTGSYTTGYFGQQMAAGLDAVEAVPNLDDTATFDAPNASLSLHVTAAHKSFGANLRVKATDGSPRAIELLQATSFQGGGDQLQFERTTDQAAYEHHGAASNFSLRLTSVTDDGRSTQIQTPVMDIQDGDRVTVRPASWKQLEGGALTVTITHADGSQVVSQMNTFTPVSGVGCAVTPSKSGADLGLVLLGIALIASVWRRRSLG